MTASHIFGFSAISFRHESAWEHSSPCGGTTRSSFIRGPGKLASSMHPRVSPGRTIPSTYQVKLSERGKAPAPHSPVPRLKRREQTRKGLPQDGAGEPGKHRLRSGVPSFNPNTVSRTRAEDPRPPESAVPGNNWGIIAALWEAGWDVYGLGVCSQLRYLQLSLAVIRRRRIRSD
jgi:hypothetical protein